MAIGAESLLLTDRVAVVTGAAAGIGAATAAALAGLGARLALCDRQAEPLAATADAIARSGGTVRSEVLDVRDAEAVEGFMTATAAELGGIDILVNNAGGTFHALFADTSAKGEATLIAENFGTVTNCVRSALPLLADGASIVNVTSVEAFHAAPGFAVYAAMKAAVQQFTQTLALELGGRGIRVNCVAPDMIETSGDAELAAASSAMSGDHHPTPLQRMGSAEECAAVIAFLASDLAGFVTGASIPVDGGTTAGAAWKAGLDGGFVM